MVQHMYHETNPSDDRTKLVHNVKMDISFLKEIRANVEIPKKANTYLEFGVNSIHHQVVHTVPQEASVIARYSGNNNNKKDYDKCIEALYYPKYNIITVQWHPEETRSVIDVSIVRYLLSIKDMNKNETTDKI